MHSVFIDVIRTLSRAIRMVGFFDQFFGSCFKRDCQKLISVLLAFSRCSLIFVSFLPILLVKLQSCTISQHPSRIILISIRLLAQDCISVALSLIFVAIFL